MFNGVLHTNCHMFNRIQMALDMLKSSPSGESETYTKRGDLEQASGKANLWCIKNIHILKFLAGLERYGFCPMCRPCHRRFIILILMLTSWPVGHWPYFLISGTIEADLLRGFFTREHQHPTPPLFLTKRNIDILVFILLARLVTNWPNKHKLNIEMLQSGMIV